MRSFERSGKVARGEWSVKEVSHVLSDVVGVLFYHVRGNVGWARGSVFKFVNEMFYFVLGDFRFQGF